MMKITKALEIMNQIPIIKMKKAQKEIIETKRLHIKPLVGVEIKISIMKIIKLLNQKFIITI